MLKVHVWRPKGDMVGHSSLSYADKYISFWPDGGAGKKDVKLKTSQPGQLIGSLSEDIKNEGDRNPETIEITKFDAKKLEKFIGEIKNDIPKYQIANYNCSNVVAEAIQVATGVKPDFEPNATSYGMLASMFGRGVWTPEGVLKYAKQVSEKSKPSDENSK
ncbi:MAG: hypothetical protein AAF479_01925 [Pseudomonadota bacterium]